MRNKFRPQRRFRRLTGTIGGMNLMADWAAHRYRPQDTTIRNASNQGDLTCCARQSSLSPPPRYARRRRARTDGGLGSSRRRSWRLAWRLGLSPLLQRLCRAGLRRLQVRRWVYTSLRTGAALGQSLLLIRLCFVSREHSRVAKDGPAPHRRPGPSSSDRRSVLRGLFAALSAFSSRPARGAGACGTLSISVSPPRWK